MNRLKVHNVSVSYGKKRVLKPVSFEVKEGEIIGLIGADGAGKSSLMHAIAGVISFSGEIELFNYSYRSPKEAEKIKKNTGFMPQGIGLILYDQLSIDEHIDFFANIRAVKQDADFKAYKERLLHMAGLLDYTDRQAGRLSGGMMQKLALICTLLHRPRLLILDEPTTGVDPVSRLELWEILKEIVVRQNTLCLISTAYMAEVDKMDKALLFEEGEIIDEGRAEELISKVKPFSYEASDKPVDGTITIHGYTYSLEPLPIKHKKPTLNSVFFVSFLKKYGRLPEIDIIHKDKKQKPPDTIMKATGLTKYFGNFAANKHIDIKLNKGEILGLLGANGAGKTTFIKMLLGLLPIDEGELFLLGKKIESTADRQMLKAKIGYVSQHFALYKGLTVRENLLYFANMHKIAHLRAIKLINDYADTLGFSDYLDVFPKDLPLGINQRFSVAAAIIHEPVVLFLDEPTSGVDVVARAVFWEMLQKLKNEWEISILITTHYMNEAEFCDRVVLLKDGEKIADDNVAALYKKHPDAHSFEDIFLEYFSKGI